MADDEPHRGGAGESHGAAGGTGVPPAPVDSPPQQPPSWRPTFLLITCEHGGHDIPRAYRAHFRGATEILRSHRGWDPGALTLAQRLAADLAAPLIFSTTSRLLVELNRSLDQPDLFSEFTRSLPAAAREDLLARYYHPYRFAVHQTLDHAIRAGERALHLSVHSFTPRLGDEVRTVGVGLLFDPARPSEAALADWWLPRLRARNLDVRANEPYKGTDDGLTTTLRAEFSPDAYAGLELEVRSDLLALRGRRRAAGFAGDLLDVLATGAVQQRRTRSGPGRY
jgi:predicted N-formylglutamate amidohydrolase